MQAPDLHPSQIATLHAPEIPFTSAVVETVYRYAVKLIEKIESRLIPTIVL